MLSYPARIRRDGEGFVVSFPDIPEALTGAETREEALAMAADALTTAMDFYFEDRRPALLGHFHARVFHMHDVHLERLDEEVLVIPAIRAGQGHSGAPLSGLVCYSHLRPIVGDSPAMGKQETCLRQTFCRQS